MQNIFKHLLLIIFGIVLYILLNNKESFLIDFDIKTMNKCKNKTCSLNDGDCKQQCLRTLFYTDETIYERAIRGNSNKVITDYLSQFDNFSSQDMEPPHIPVTDYEWLKNLDDLTLKLIDIFSNIPINKARLILFIMKGHRTFWHFIIFSRSETSIYMLDPKHKIINKNSDILYHPWFNKFIREDTFDWSMKYYNRLEYGLYFWPIYNTDKTDVNPNKEADNKIIKALLTNKGNANLNDAENSAYIEWTRRISTGEIVEGVECTDLPDEIGNEWREPDPPRNNCSAYERNPRWCSLRADARRHCCVCGGGSRGSSGAAAGDAAGAAAGAAGPPRPRSRRRWRSARPEKPRSWPARRPRSSPYRPS